MIISSGSFHILLAHILHRYENGETNKGRKAKKQPTKYKSSHPYRNSLMQSHIVSLERADYQKCFLLT